MATNINDWRYENPGTADLLTVAGTTITGFDGSKSKTGTAFYQTNKAKCFDIPACKEIWIKFDVYFDGSNRWRAYNGGSNGSSGITAQTDGRLSFFVHGTNQGLFDNVCHTNQLQTVLLHMVSGSSSGVVEAWVDGNFIYRYTGNVNNGSDFADIYLQSDGAGTFFSNVIISNAQIEITDDVNQERTISADFDLIRNTANVVTVNHDTDRNVTIPQVLSVDLLRNITASSTLNLDTERQLSVNVTVDVDTERKINAVLPITTDFDLARNITVPATLNLDTERKISATESLNIDTRRDISKFVDVEFDTLRDTMPSQFALTLDFDLARDTRVFRYEQAELSSRSVDTPFPIKELWVQFDSDFDVEDYSLYDDIVFMVGATDNPESDYGSRVELRLVYDSNGNFDHLSIIFAQEDDWYQYFDVEIPQTSTYIFHLKPEGDYCLFELWINGNLVANYTGERPAEYYGDFVKVNFERYKIHSIYNFVATSAELPITKPTETIWRYENEGKIDTVLKDSITEDYYVTFEVSEEFSRTGYGYVSASNYYSIYKSFDLPETAEIWIKFDCYFDDFVNGCDGVWNEEDHLSYLLEVGSAYTPSSDYDGVEKDGLSIRCNYTDTSVAVALDRYNVSENYATPRLAPCKIHRFLVHMKNGADGKIELFIDGNLCTFYEGKVHGSNTLGNIYLRSNGGLISNLIISNDAVDPSADVSSLTFPKSLTVDFAAYRDISSGVWWYKNPGTDSTLAYQYKNFSNLPATQSKTGTAFSKNTPENCFIFTPTNEVWIRFDVYRPAESNVYAGIWLHDSDNYGKNFDGFYGGFGGNVVFRNDDKTIIRTTRYLGPNTRYYYDKKLPWFMDFNIHSADLIITDKLLNAEELSTCLLHMKIGNGDDLWGGLIELWINDELVGRVIGNVNDGNLIDRLSLVAENDDDHRVLFSNITISNVYPDLSIVNFDTCRSVRNLAQVDFDIARALPHIVTLSPVYGESADTAEDDQQKVQSWEVQISEQQLTDTVNFVTSRPVDILEQVKGQYLDYKFNLRVEKVTERGILRYCNCCSDIDELLFKQIAYTVPDSEQWHDVSTDTSAQTAAKEEDNYALASVHISTLAKFLGKKTVLQFDDFVSTVDINSGGATYNDLIKNIFGWTARLPHLMINCYLRDDKLFVVQRGYESNIVDLSDYKSDVTSKSREIIRTVWGSSTWAKTETREWNYPNRNYWQLTQGDNDNNNDFMPKSRGNNKYSYDNDGLINKTETVKGNNRTVTTYEYQTLSNGRKFLYKETTEIYEDGELIDTQVTTHEPLFQQQVHTATFNADGDYLGNVIGNGSGDDRVTPFTIFQSNNDSLILIEPKVQQERTIYGITLFDTSFPVHGDEKLKKITDAIKWLNRKIQETVTLNVYDFPHVIDFNDRLIIGGNTYYLQSNTALKNYRIVNKQTVSAVRWY